MTRRKNIEEARPGRHDDLVAELLKNSNAVVQAAGWASAPGKPLIVVERPCGKGHIDICMSWKCRLCAEHDKAIGFRGIIVEVKSELEQWSAGDVIRQLKGYKKNFDQRSTGWFYDDEGTRIGDTSECFRCKLRESTLALFSGRALTESERLLLRHERVFIVEPKWRAVEGIAHAN
jgi:hypothetical protein